jgi:hypothetical protein
MEEPPQEHALTRDRLLATNRQVHPLVDRTIEVIDSCCRGKCPTKWLLTTSGTGGEVEGKTRAHLVT